MSQFEERLHASQYKAKCIQSLMQAGISYEDAAALRRISMTLHRWHEMECGESNNYASWCVVRGQKSIGEFIYDDTGKPHIERHSHRGNSKASYSPIPDRERGAQKRLAAIMARYPHLTAYVQGDPRGAALYILQTDYVAQMTSEGNDIDSFYSRGIAVYK